MSGINGTYTPGGLGLPADVIEFTATSNSVVQFTVDGTPLGVSDVVNVTISDDVTGAMAAFINEDMDRNTVDPSGKTYMILLDDGDTIKLTLNWLEGTAGSINYAMRVVSED